MSFEQAAPLLLHFPALGQFAFVLQSVTASVHRPLPQAAAEAHGAAVLLQVPFVTQPASVWQAEPFFGPAPVHLPSVGWQNTFNVQALEVHSPLPMPLQSEFLVHTLVLFAHVIVWHTPPVSGQSALLVQDVMPLLHRPLVAVQVAADIHCWPTGLPQVPGQS